MPKYFNGTFWDSKELETKEMPTDWRMAKQVVAHGWNVILLCYKKQQTW